LTLFLNVNKIIITGYTKYIKLLKGGIHMADEYHEKDISSQAQEYHRMIQSVIEEMEAVDWYNQRADVTNDQELKSIVEHNRDEEIEHACMGLEWLRRNNPVWEENLKTFLFSQGPITAVEENEGNSDDNGEENNNNSDQSLGLNNLKGGK